MNDSYAPSLAIAIAISLPVTVSIAADKTEYSAQYFLVIRVLIFTSRGRTFDFAGIRSTSSKVIAVPVIFFLFHFL